MGPTAAGQESTARPASRRHVWGCLISRGNVGIPEALGTPMPLAPRQRTATRQWTTTRRRTAKCCAVGRGWEDVARRLAEAGGTATSRGTGKVPSWHVGGHCHYGKTQIGWGNGDCLRMGLRRGIWPRVIREGRFVGGNHRAANGGLPGCHRGRPHRTRPPGGVVGKMLRILGHSRIAKLWCVARYVTRAIAENVARAGPGRSDR
jgi:hypothetical protein